MSKLTNERISEVLKNKKKVFYPIKIPILIKVKNGNKLKKYHLL